MRILGKKIKRYWISNVYKSKQYVILVHSAKKKVSSPDSGEKIEKEKIKGAVIESLKIKNRNKEYHDIKRLL